MAPRGKRKRAQPQIRTNIPLDQNAVVTRVEVTRDPKQRILTKSRRVSVPVTDPPPSQDTSLQASDPLLFTTGDPLDPARKKARKGPSRSVAVCFPFFVITLYFMYTNSQAADKPRAVASVSRRIFR